MIHEYKITFKIFKNYYIIVFFLCVLFIPLNIFSQEKSNNKKIDSLSRLDFELLNTYIKSNDSLLSAISLRAYLLKAKRENDTLKVTSAYLLLTNQTKNISYTDSIIYLLKNSNSKFNERLSIAYFGKGIYSYNKHKYNESLKNYLAANKLLSGPDIDMNIGLIKIQIGEYEEALKIFQKLKSSKQNNSDDLWLYFALAETHRHLKNRDSTSFYVDIGHKEAARIETTELKAYFTLLQGANSYGLKKYHQSIDSMVSVSREFINNGDQANLMYNYYFTGISNYKLGRNRIALNYFKKIDSLYLIIKHIEPEFRKSYEILINESSKNNDLKNQLKYVRRLISIDSALATDYKYLTKNLYKKYDSPKLLAEKQKLIKLINQESSKAYTWLKVVVSFLFILILVIIYFIKQNTKNKKKFESLMQGFESQKVIKIANKNYISKKKKLNINPEVVNTILKKLEKFEKNKDFINSNITLNNLSHQFETNSKYLSQTIKHFRHKKFSDYINSLRIEYAIEELKNNFEYKKYTLKAIAKEFGFNSTESFSSAFFKTTGLKPSYFLKELWSKT